jgi:DNA-binding GntR family transcriptional regulator
MASASASKRDTSQSDLASVDRIPDEIYDTIFRAILDRALDPGTKLPEDIFCKHYDVSRTIVRVAIHRLQQDRLVEVQRNKGCFVVVPDHKEASAIMAARRALEPFVVHRLVEVATEKSLALLDNHIGQEDQAYARADRRAALRLSGKFHLLLAELADSSVIEGFLKNLVCRSALVISTYSNVTEACKAHDHRRIVELLKARNAEGAIAEMLHHLQDIERDLLQEEPIEERPSLESVLSQYAPGSGRRGRSVA